MRSPMLLTLLTLAALPANAEERTWKISTGTYTVAAELVEVRGDIAHLKIGDKVEHIPFARLSAADHQYIASLGPTLIFPGPAEDRITEEALPGPRNEFKPFPPSGVVASQNDSALSFTAKKPPIEPAAEEQLPAGTSALSNYSEELLPLPASSGPPKTVARQIDPRALNNSNANPNARRPPQQQKQNQNNAENKNRSREDERRGLFGGRSRRLGIGR